MIDIKGLGNNAKLIEEMASDIGTTGNKLFPFYMKEAVLEGYMFIGTSMLAFTSGAIMLFFCITKADWCIGNLHAVLSLISLVIIGSAFIVFFSGIKRAISKILNPCLFAIQSVILDARLLGKS